MIKLYFFPCFKPKPVLGVFATKKSNRFSFCKLWLEPWPKFGQTNQVSSCSLLPFLPTPKTLKFRQMVRKWILRTHAASRLAHGKCLTNVGWIFHCRVWCSWSRYKRTYECWTCVFVDHQTSIAVQTMPRPCHNTSWQCRDNVAVV